MLHSLKIKYYIEMKLESTVVRLPFKLVKKKGFSLHSSLQLKTGIIFFLVPSVNLGAGFTYYNRPVTSSYVSARPTSTEHLLWQYLGSQW